MKLNLFTKSEDIRKSAPLVGAKIIALLDSTKSSKISIFELAKKLRNSDSIGIRTIYYAMIFLYCLELIEFDEPYLVRRNDKN